MLSVDPGARCVCVCVCFCICMAASASRDSPCESAHRCHSWLARCCATSSIVLASRFISFLGQLCQPSSLSLLAIGTPFAPREHPEAPFHLFSIAHRLQRIPSPYRRRSHPRRLTLTCKLCTCALETVFTCALALVIDLGMLFRTRPRTVGASCSESSSCGGARVNSPSGAQRSR